MKVLEGSELSDDKEYLNMRSRLVLDLHFVICIKMYHLQSIYRCKLTDHHLQYLKLSFFYLFMYFPFYSV